MSHNALYPQIASRRRGPFLIPSNALSMRLREKASVTAKDTPV